MSKAGNSYERKSFTIEQEINCFFLPTRLPVRINENNVLAQ